jgi:beta-galactosidase GanA
MRQQSIWVNALAKKLIQKISILCTLLFVSSSLVAQAAPLPELITKNGKHILMVDGAPFIMLGAQTNNSSNYPAALKDVWPSVEKMSANTLSIPVAWEQIEPKEGVFDFSYVDVLIQQASERNVKVVLLWFATWKNNAPHFAPAWVKLDNERFPRVVKKDGDTLNSLSPLGKNTLAADKKAFVALMKHLQKNDKENTVIMVQVQNEVGSYGTVRDFSPAAQKEFNAPVPADLVKALKLTNGNWAQVFGKDADEFFHAYHIAKYCNEITAAGKAIKALPMYVNVALRNPFNPGVPGAYSSGGGTDNVLHIWKAAAPDIDFIAPDIYFRDHKTVSKVLELYARPDNALFVAEIGNDQPYARYFYSTLGKGGIGFSPFGMDDTDYTNYPLGAKVYNNGTIEEFAQHYRLVAPMMREWAKLSFESKVWGVAEPVDTTGDLQKIWNAEATPAEKEKHAKEKAAALTQTLDLGLWNAEVTYGRYMFWIDPPVGNTPAAGGALIAQLGENEYLVTAHKARVEFKPSAELAGQKFMIVSVEEGHYENGKWVMERIWNGDQTDWGLNFTARPHLLKVKMATYKTH